MTRYNGLGGWILGVSILTCGCTTTTTGNGSPFENGDGGIGDGLSAPGNGGANSSGNGNGNGTGTGTGSGNANGNGNANGTATGTAVSSGAREPPLLAIEKAVLTVNSCSPKAGASACTTCVLRSCCTQTSACQDNNFCVTLAGCLSPCNDKSCVNECTDNYDPGVPTYQDIFSCVNTYCTSSCG